MQRNRLSVVIEGIQISTNREISCSISFILVYTGFSLRNINIQERL